MIVVLDFYDWASVDAVAAAVAVDDAALRGLVVVAADQVDGEVAVAVLFDGVVIVPDVLEAAQVLDDAVVDVVADAAVEVWDAAAVEAWDVAVAADVVVL